MKTLKIHRKRLALAVASAITFVPMIAVAATPTATQLPGQGYVLTNSAGVTSTVATGALGVTVASGNTIIQWGGAPYTSGLPTINSAGSAGFNIGASAAVTFTNTGTTAGPASVLNIDATGNPSQILGSLTAVSGASAAGAPTLFVANQNGIVVGSGATIVAPTGIGFLNSAFNNNPTTGALADFVAGTADLVFTGATGGVNIEASANLSGVSSTLLIAGAGTVNVNFAGITQPGGTTGGIPLIVDGGVGGTAFVTATTYVPQSTGSIPTTGMTYGAPVQTTVNLNLGVTGNTYLTAAPYVFANGSSVLAYGDVNIGSTAVIGGSSTASSPLPIEWTGTLTNSGIVNASSAGFTNGTVAVALVSGSASVDALQGNFVNASGATFADYGTSDTAYTMAGSFTNNGIFTGVSLGEINAALGVVNTGTLNTGIASGSTFAAAAGTSGSVDLGGVLNFSTTTGGAFNLDLTAGQNVTYGATVSFGTTGSYLGTATMDASSGAAVLASGLNLASSASIAAGTNISLNAPLAVSNTTGSASVTLSAGKLITVGSSAAISVTGSSSATNAVYVTAGNGVDFGSSVTVANGGTGGTAINVALTNANAPTSFTLGSGATLSATSIALGDYTSGTTTSAVSTAYQIGGSVTASSVTFGLNSTGGQLVTDQVNSVTGAGTITANSVTFNNVTGNINNRVGANPLGNGFNLAAASSTSPMTVAWTLNGNSAQAVNLNIAGAANLTGSNATPLLNNNTATVGANVAPNAGSSLLVQASGIINLAGGSNGGVAGFTFPGGVAFVSKTGITQNAALYNGWSMNPVAFQGVFFDAPSISVNGSIYTNANSYVNFSVAPNVLPSIYQVSQNQYTGNFSYTPTSVAIHQNSYTTIANTAATGGNWVAQVNTTPITSLGQFK